MRPVPTCEREARQSSNAVKACPNMLDPFGRNFEKKTRTNIRNSDLAGGPVHAVGRPETTLEAFSLRCFLRWLQNAYLNG